MGDTTIKIELPELHREFVFDSPDRLRAWEEALRREWGWLANTPARQAWSPQNDRLTRIRTAREEWARSPDDPNNLGRARAALIDILKQLYGASNLVPGNDAACAFIKDIVEKHGETAASGAYAVLSHCNVQIDSNVPESFFTGLVRGFLFQNEIDWTASAHRAVLEDLETKYKQRLDDQENRLQELEAANKRLNDAYDLTLREKATALDEVTTNKSSQLDELYRAKDVDFTNLKTQHEANFKASEDTFHNKLALQKPVDYWVKRHTSHVRMAWGFALAALACLGVAAYEMTRLIEWAFGKLGPNENPKHWEVGVVVLCAFVAVWVIRILVRLFLSHQHLATDAAQRVTMVQTFLSLSKEEGGLRPEDRSVILQQLFKSAGDGLVKDDGTPPGWAELLSRPK